MGDILNNKYEICLIRTGASFEFDIERMLNNDI